MSREKSVLGVSSTALLRPKGGQQLVHVLAFTPAEPANRVVLVAADVRVGPPARPQPVLHRPRALPVEPLKALPVGARAVAAKGEDDRGRDRQPAELEACRAFERVSSICS